MTDYQDAYNERWPAADDVEQEMYRMTNADRRMIREARDKQVRDRLHAHKERMKISCACLVCLGHETNVHGEALYLNRRIRCRCVTCRADRAAKELERKHRREQFRREMQELLRLEQEAA